MTAQSSNLDRFSVSGQFGQSSNLDSHQIWTDLYKSLYLHNWRCKDLQRSREHEVMTSLPPMKKMKKFFKVRWSRTELNSNNHSDDNSNNYKWRKYLTKKILQNHGLIDGSRVSHSVGGGGHGGRPHLTIFFEEPCPPLKNDPPRHPIWKKITPLKHETLFHDMIPRKSTIT